MAWIYLLIAGAAEIVWAYGLKMSHGFTNIGWTLSTLFFIAFSFYFFARSMRTIPIGTAYAVFTGIGAAGTAVVGIVYLSEDLNFLKVASLLVLIAGIAGLKILDKGENKEPETNKTIG